MGTDSRLTAFLQEWDGPLPRGFRALASAKCIILPKPFSPPHAMRLKLGRVCLPESLEVLPMSLVCNHSGAAFDAHEQEVVDA